MKFVHGLAILSWVSPLVPFAVACGGNAPSGLFSSSGDTASSQAGADAAHAGAPAAGAGAAGASSSGSSAGEASVGGNMSAAGSGESGGASAGAAAGGVGVSGHGGAPSGGTAGAVSGAAGANAGTGGDNGGMTGSAGAGSGGTSAGSGGTSAGGTSGTSAGGTGGTSAGGAGGTSAGGTGGTSAGGGMAGSPGCPASAPQANNNCFTSTPNSCFYMGVACSCQQSGPGNSRRWACYGSQDKCPEALPVSTATCKLNNGAQCPYPGGDFCACTGNGFGPGNEAKWTCQTPPVTCPALKPPKNQACAAVRACAYDDDQCFCDGNSWACESNN
jgi:hypothetical protein